MAEQDKPAVLLAGAGRTILVGGTFIVNRAACDLRLPYTGVRLFRDRLALSR